MKPLCFNRIGKTVCMCAWLCLCSLCLPGGQAAAGNVGSSVMADYSKELKQGDKVTIFMGREARNITIDWGEMTDCVFDIQISCGHGSFNSVSVEKAKGAGRQTYKFVRMTVEELRIVILKGSGTIRNMQTLSTKAEDNSSYNPI